MSKLSRKDIWFIGLVGLPYYIFCMFLIMELVSHNQWSFLLFIPSLYFYDYFSQNGFRAIVIGMSKSKLQYCIKSFFYQFIFIGFILGLLWLSKT